MGSTSNAVQATAVARVVGVEDVFVDLREAVANLPQHIMIVGQGNTAATYDTTPTRYFNALDVANAYGFGSPLHLAMLQVFPPLGFEGVGTIPVTVFPLEDNGSGTAAAGNITMSGGPATSTETYAVRISGILSDQFAIPEGTAASAVAALMVTAINAVLEMPVTVVDNAGVLEFTSKWAGESANDIFVEVIGPDAGITFAVTQASGGAADPDVTDALTQADPDVWYTLIVNCLNASNTTALDEYQQFGTARINPIDNKRLTAWTGSTETDVNTLVAIGDARPLDQFNGLRTAPGSVDLPLAVCARQVAVAALIANDNPPRDYGSTLVEGVTPGAGTDQWTYAERDALTKAGISTSLVKDGVIQIKDTVTFYHPTGDVTPAYRYLCDIVKLSNFIFNVQLAFNVPEWDGAPLIPNFQPTTNKSAKKPKHAVAEMWQIIDSAALVAWISDPETAKARTVANIDETNPKRLDVATTIQLSGNTNIISVTLNWGFFFGQAPVVA